MIHPSSPLDALNHRFAIDDRLRFHSHSSGLVVGHVKTKCCTGAFFLQGAHVSAFHPSHTPQPVLFLSERAVVSPGKPLRGGIPICFPWFGAHAADPHRPAHGWARTSLWRLLRTRCEGDSIEVFLVLDEFPFRLEVRLQFGEVLEVNWAAKNDSGDVLESEVALHSYFSVGGIADVSVAGGLEELPYYDQLTGQTHEASGQPIRFDQETDRIYDGSAPLIELRDTSWNRTIRIAAENSMSTVVWNPWIAKSQRMTDFGDEEYLRMCCIETANVRSQCVVLEPGETHRMALRIEVHPD